MTIDSETMRTDQPRMADQDHLALLKRAIAANLDAREEHDRRQERAARGKPAVDLKMWCIGDLMNTPEEQLYLDSVIEDPVRKALQRQLKDLGWRLYRLLGNTDAMARVAEEIANMKPRHWGSRTDIIDKNWDGIGNGNDVWVA